MVAEDTLVAKIVQRQDTAATFEQAAAVAALNGPQDCVEEMRRAFRERYDFMYEELNALPGVDCPSCDGAFYVFPSFEGFLANRDDIRDDTELATWMLEEAGVSTVPGSAFGAPGHLRLSYAASMDYLQDAIARMKRAMS